MTQKELDEKLQKLRDEYKTAGPGLRKLIIVRANLLKKRFAEEAESLPNAYERWKEITENQDKDSGVNNPAVGNIGGNGDSDNQNQ